VVSPGVSRTAHRRFGPPIPNDKLSGIAVHIGARVASHAAANEVLVSSTVKDLVAGSGIRFEDPGVQSLKGAPGEWRLFAVGADG
jgi:class 3 adenylate cyclase